MFLTTPIIRWTANRLYRQGRIEQEHRDRLLLQDKHLNIVITAGALCLLIKYFTPYL
jgi:hypothetical protein